MASAKAGTAAIGTAGQGAGRFAAQVQRRHAAQEPDEETPPRHEGKSPQPSLHFAMPAARPPSPAGPEPSQTATQDTAEAGQKPAPGGADARAVADRVYELMKQEIIQERGRGGR